MIDFEAGRTVATRAVLEGILDWTAPARAQLGLDVELPERNGAQRSLAGARRGGLDRGDLPRGGRRDAPHLRA